MEKSLELKLRAKINTEILFTLKDRLRREKKMYNVIAVMMKKISGRNCGINRSGKSLDVKFAFYAKWRASVEIFRRRKNICRYYNNRYKMPIMDGMN